MLQQPLLLFLLLLLLLLLLQLLLLLLLLLPLLLLLLQLLSLQRLRVSLVALPPVRWSSSNCTPLRHLGTHVLLCCLSQLLLLAAHALPLCGLGIRSQRRLPYSRSLPLLWLLRLLLLLALLLLLRQLRPPRLLSVKTNKNRSRDESFENRRLFRKRVLRIRGPRLARSDA